MSKKHPHSLVLGDRIEQSIYGFAARRLSSTANLLTCTVSTLAPSCRLSSVICGGFPADFMYRLTKEELENWRSHFVTSNPSAKMGLRRPPYAFTEQGVAMLSSVLRSRRAVQVNIEIMRAFVRLRRVLAVNAELARRLDEVEEHVGKHDEQFVEVIRAIRHLMEPPPRPPRRRIGFQVPADAAGDTKPPGKSQKAKRRI